MSVAIPVALVGLLVAPIGLLTVLVGAGASDSYACSSDGDDILDLSEVQAANARTIVQVGGRMAVPGYGLVVAVATALQESGLRNLGFGDRDSLGLFQQRPSQGWGAPAQILDPAYAAGRFFSALLRISGWQKLSVSDAAQAVQRSAFPDAYARWADDAERIVAALLTSTAVAGAGCDVASVADAAADRVVGFAAAQVGDAYALGAVGPNAWDCSSLVQAAFWAGGVHLPRTASAQYDLTRAHGQLLPGPITLTQLLPGDLLFSGGAAPATASDGTPIGHVALYAGNGWVVEAKGRAWGVVSRR